MVSLGEAIIDHVGSDAARAMFADLDQRPALYLARFEGRFVERESGDADASLFLATPLWHLRRHDPQRAREVAERVLNCYQELRSRVAWSDDPGFAHRLAERFHAMRLIRDGVDVVPEPGWQLASPGSGTVCADEGLDHAPLLVVSQVCGCGERMSCRATVRGGALHVELRVEYGNICIGVCSPTGAACTLPALPPGTSVSVEVNSRPIAPRRLWPGGPLRRHRRVGVNAPPVASWQIDAQGRPLGVNCPLE